MTIPHGTKPQGSPFSAPSSDDPFVLIGPDPEDAAVSSWADNLLDEITFVLGEHKTEELEAIAAYRDKVYRDGWMQRLIREYIEVWR